MAHAAGPNPPMSPGRVDASMMLPIGLREQLVGADRIAQDEIYRRDLVIFARLVSVLKLVESYESIGIQGK